MNSDIVYLDQKLCQHCSCIKKDMAHYNFWVTSNLMDLNGGNRKNLKFFVTETSLLT